MTEAVQIRLFGVTVHRPTEKWIGKTWIGDRLIDPGCTSVEEGAIIHVPPGEAFEVEAPEAASLLRRWPGEIISENPPPSVVSAKQAHDDAKTAEAERNKPSAELEGSGTRPSPMQNW
jgi:hypothetical protein